MSLAGASPIGTAGWATTWVTSSVFPSAIVGIPAFAIALVLRERVGQPARGALLSGIVGTLAVGTWLAVAGGDLVPALLRAMSVVALALPAFMAWAAKPSRELSRT